MNDRNESQGNRNLYFLVLPVDPRHCTDSPRFLVTYTMQKEELTETINTHAFIQNCKSEDILVVKCYMSEDKFEKMEGVGGEVTPEVKEFILGENQKHKSNHKLVESLSNLAAKKLAEYPSFFNHNLATDEAKELFIAAMLVDEEKQLQEIIEKTHTTLKK